MRPFQTGSHNNISLEEQKYSSQIANLPLSVSFPEGLISTSSPRVAAVAPDLLKPSRQDTGPEPANLSVLSILGRDWTGLNLFA